MYTSVFIGLGSNVGDVKNNIDTALRLISTHKINIKKRSKLYITPPWGNQHQPPFLNCVIQVGCSIDAFELLQTLLQIELEMGRVRNLKWEPRIIDLDILCFENLILDTEILTLPHPYLHLRQFVLEPLNDIASDYLVAPFNKTVYQLLQELKMQQDAILA